MQVTEGQLHHALDVGPTLDVADQPLIEDAVDQPLRDELMHDALEDDSVDRRVGHGAVPAIGLAC